MTSLGNIGKNLPSIEGKVERETFSPLGSFHKFSYVGLDCG